MSARTRATPQRIQSLADRINAERPIETSTSPGAVTAGCECIRPRRYEVCVIIDANGSERILAAGMTASECDRFLSGILEGIKLGRTTW